MNYLIIITIILILLIIIILIIIIIIMIIMTGIGVPLDNGRVAPLTPTRIRRTRIPPARASLPGGAPPPPPREPAVPELAMLWSDPGLGHAMVCWGHGRRRDPGPR